MKRILASLLLLVTLTGCGRTDREMDRVLAFRQRILSAESTFQVDITADYGQEYYQFSMACKVDKQGGMEFTVTDPETISGITGTIQQGKGHLTFDDTVLAFQTMADGLVTPVTGPWLMMKALRGGYIQSCGPDEENLRIRLCDSYEEDALVMDLWLSPEDHPVQADIYWKECRILTLSVKNFATV